MRKSPILFFLLIFIAPGEIFAGAFSSCQLFMEHYSLVSSQGKTTPIEVQARTACQSKMYHPLVLRQVSIQMNTSHLISELKSKRASVLRDGDQIALFDVSLILEGKNRTFKSMLLDLKTQELRSYNGFYQKF